MLYLSQYDKSSGKTLFGQKLSEGQRIRKLLRGELALDVERAAIYLKPFLQPQTCKQIQLGAFDAIRFGYIGKTPRKTRDGIELTVSYHDLLPTPQEPESTTFLQRSLRAATQPFRGLQETAQMMASAFMSADIKTFRKRLLPGDNYESVKLDAAEYYMAEIAKIDAAQRKTLAGQLQKKLDEASDFLAHYTAKAVNHSDLVHFVNEQLDIDIGEGVGGVFGEIIVGPFRAIPGLLQQGSKYRRYRLAGALDVAFAYLDVATLGGTNIAHSVLLDTIKIVSRNSDELTVLMRKSGYEQPERLAKMIREDLALATEAERREAYNFMVSERKKAGLTVPEDYKAQRRPSDVVKEKFDEYEAKRKKQTSRTRNEIDEEINAVLEKRKQRLLASAKSATEEIDLNDLEEIVDAGTLLIERGTHNIKDWSVAISSRFGTYTIPYLRPIYRRVKRGGAPKDIIDDTIDLATPIDKSRVGRTVIISGNEFGKNLDSEGIRNAARKYLKQLSGRFVRVAEDGNIVEIATSASQKIGADPEKAKFAIAFEDIIRNSKYLYSELDGQGRPSTNWLKYLANVEVQGKKYQLRLFIRVDSSGNLIHDWKNIDIIK